MEENDRGRIGLADAIERVRAELKEAQDSGEGSDLRFRLGEVQLQFEVAMTREGTGKLGIKLWVVVDVGAEGTISRGTTQTVTVTLKPEQLVGDQWQDATVSDRVEGKPK